MKHFANDEAGYLNWIAENPEGFVLNVERSPRPSYLVLHRATCSTIAKPRDDGAYTDRGYQKVVASDLNELRGYARRVGRADGSFSKACGHCQPE
ncbi:MAG: hypothetical protein ACKOQ8_06635 [Micrococcales bacterium]